MHLGQQQSGNPLNLHGVELSLAYASDFSGKEMIDREDDMTSDGQRSRRPYPDAGWIAEGSGGAKICEGKLWVAPSKFSTCGETQAIAESDPSNMVLWNAKKFPSDLLLEFTVNHHGSNNGLTLVFFAAQGLNGRDIFDLALPPRRADYKSYNRGLANYTVSYWSRNRHKNAIKNRERYSNRVRKNPGMNLLASNPSQTDVCNNCEYNVRILKIGGAITVEVNGEVVNHLTDTDRPHESGYIGLRSMRGVNKISYDNFRVWSVSRMAKNKD